MRKLKKEDTRTHAHTHLPKKRTKALLELSPLAATSATFFSTFHFFCAFFLSIPQLLTKQTDYKALYS
jgi:hypothetical protein